MKLIIKGSVLGIDTIFMFALPSPHDYSFGGVFQGDIFLCDTAAGTKDRALAVNESVGKGEPTRLAWCLSRLGEDFKH
jgi:hypothetical protein